MSVFAFSTAQKRSNVKPTTFPPPREPQHPQIQPHETPTPIPKRKKAAPNQETAPSENRITHKRTTHKRITHERATPFDTRTSTLALVSSVHQKVEQMDDTAAEAAAVDDHVHEALLQQKLRPLESLRQV